MPYNIRIEEKECIGCGTCAAICDENYKMDDNGIAKVKNSTVNELSCNEEAKNSCPASCIHIDKT